MLEKRTPMPVGMAVNKIMQDKVKGSMEYVSIDESYGRYLAEEIAAANDVPHFDKAPYDGFAIRSIDTKDASLSNPIEFEVIDHIGAGIVSGKELGPLQVIRIMTGAQMPAGSDAVVMLEVAATEERDGKPYMTIKRSFKKGENVCFRGEDAKKGEVIVEKGTYINPGIQAVLATFGYAKVPVAKKPIVGLFATGTELLEVEDELEPGKIRNSNSHMIMAQIERAGAEVRYFGKLTDDLETCYEAISKSIHDVDLIMTTGGVSVGDFDFLPEIYERLGAEVLFNKVAMRPGSVTTVAKCQDKLLFGLSGNPSACYVGFELFARPIIRTMLFSHKPHLRKEKAILQEDFSKANPFTRFVRSTLSVLDGRLVVRTSGRDKSNIVMSLAGANSLTVLPGGTRGYKSGEEVDVLLLEDTIGGAWPW